MSLPRDGSNYGEIVNLPLIFVTLVTTALTTRCYRGIGSIFKMLLRRNIQCRDSLS